MFGSSAKNFATLTPAEVENEPQLLAQLRGKLGPSASTERLLYHIRAARGKVHWAVNSFLREAMAQPPQQSVGTGPHRSSPWPASHDQQHNPHSTTATEIKEAAVVDGQPQQPAALLDVCGAGNSSDRLWQVPSANGLSGNGGVLSSGGAGIALDSLPTGVLETVVCHLCDHASVVALGMTCHTLKKASRCDAAWRLLFMARWSGVIFPTNPGAGAATSTPVAALRRRLNPQSPAVGGSNYQLPFASTNDLSYSSVQLNGLLSLMNPERHASPMRPCNSTASSSTLTDGVMGPGTDTLVLTPPPSLRTTVLTQPSPCTSTTSVHAPLGTVGTLCSPAMPPPSPQFISFMGPPTTPQSQPTSQSERSLALATMPTAITSSQPTLYPATATEFNGCGCARSKIEACIWPGVCSRASTPTRSEKGGSSFSRTSTDDLMWHERYRTQALYELTRSCPSCGARDGTVVPLVYGFPSTSLLEGMRCNRLILGGDHLIEDGHCWVCTSCNASFRSYPYELPHLWQADHELLRERAATLKAMSNNAHGGGGGGGGQAGGGAQGQGAGGGGGAGAGGRGDGGDQMDEFVLPTYTYEL